MKMKSKTQQAEIRFLQKSAFSVELLKNLTMSFVTANLKSFNLSLDALNSFEDDND